MTAVGVLICIDEAISWGEVRAKAAFQMKKQKAEQIRARKKRAVQETRLVFSVIEARTFSSKTNAAIVNSKKPMAIDQNVIEALDKSFEFFLVATTETAKQVADKRVRVAPVTKSLDNSKEMLLFVDKRIDPPKTPKLNAIHFCKVRPSFNMIFPSKITNSGETSMIAADKLEEIYLSPANCNGYNNPNPEVPIIINPSHCFMFEGISIFFRMMTKTT